MKPFTSKRLPKPHDSMREFFVDITIRDNRTKEVRTLRTHEYLHDENTNNGKDVWSSYNWTDGNYSCDCNRALFFAQANGETKLESQFSENGCSEGKFVIESIVVVETGECIYSEIK